MAREEDELVTVTVLLLFLLFAVSATYRVQKYEFAVEHIYRTFLFRT